MFFDKMNTSWPNSRIRNENFSYNKNVHYLQRRIVYKFRRTRCCWDLFVGKWFEPKVEVYKVDLHSSFSMALSLREKFRSAMKKKNLASLLLHDRRFEKKTQNKEYDEKNSINYLHTFIDVGRELTMYTLFRTLYRGFSPRVWAAKIYYLIITHTQKSSIFLGFFENHHQTVLLTHSWKIVLVDPWSVRLPCLAVRDEV